MAAAVDVVLLLVVVKTAAAAVASDVLLLLLLLCCQPVAAAFKQGLKALPLNLSTHNLCQLLARCQRMLLEAIAAARAGAVVVDARGSGSICAAECCG